MKRSKRVLCIIQAVVILLMSCTVFSVSADTRTGKRFVSTELYQTAGLLAAYPHTYEMWIKLDAGVSKRGVIVGNYNDPTPGTSGKTSGVEVNANGYLDLWWGSSHHVFENYKARNGEWTFVAITQSGSEASLYINGVLTQTYTGPNTFITMSDSNAAKMAIGGDFRSNNSCALTSGELSTVALYREARTAVQISNDYAALNPNDVALLGMWDLSVSGSARLKDLSGEEMNLSYTNTKDPSLNEELPAVEPEDGMTFYDDPEFKSEIPLAATPNTFEATVWFPKDYSSASRGGVIIGNYLTGNDPGFSIEVYTNGNPRFYWVDSLSKTAVDARFDSVNLYQGKWITLTIVRDSAKNKVYCYVDGVLCQTKAIRATEDIVCNRQFSVGGDMRSKNTQAFKGRLKNVALYSDIRTAEEVYADANNPGKDTSNLLAFYALNEGVDSEKIKDATGNYNMKLYYTSEWLKSSPNTEEYAYSFAVVGDTQIMNRAYPDGFAGIYDWILDNVESKKIKCVIGLGDITDKDEPTEWERAVAQADRMYEENVPFTMAIGNHDTVAKFNQYMSCDSNAAQLEGIYEGGYQNAWRTLTVGDTDYLILILEYGPRDEVLEWAGGVIEAHPNHKVIVTTHCYLYHDGTTLDSGDTCPPKNDVHPERNNGDDMWDKFVSKYENIVMVLSGHDPSDSVIMTPAVGDNGNVVCQFLIDPQGVDPKYQNGTGLVALLCFSEDGHRCRVEYYSTVKQKYFLRDSQFIFDFRTGEKVDELNLEPEYEITVDENTESGGRSPWYYVAETVNKVTVEKTVTSLSGTVFNNFKALKDAYIMGNPTIANDVFDEKTDAVFHGWMGSNTQSFCSQNGLKFAQLEEFAVNGYQDGYTAKNSFRAAAQMRYAEYYTAAGYDITAVGSDGYGHNFNRKISHEITTVYKSLTGRLENGSVGTVKTADEGCYLSAIGFTDLPAMGENGAIIFTITPYVYNPYSGEKISLEPVEFKYTADGVKPFTSLKLNNGSSDGKEIAWSDFKD